MKKTAIALALASTVALTACGNDEPDGTDTGMEDPTVSPVSYTHLTLPTKRIV